VDHLGIHSVGVVRVPTADRIVEANTGRDPDPVPDVDPTADQDTRDRDHDLTHPVVGVVALAARRMADAETLETGTIRNQTDVSVFSD
jgi:hypothetical protein